MSLHPDVERLALLGWRLYPASRNSRKAARFPQPSERATCDLATLEQWEHDYPASNYRVVMEGSGIIALDIDAPSDEHAADGMSAMARLVAEHGALPNGPRTRSGGGGVGLIFRDDGHPIIGKTGTPAPGIDPRRGRLSLTVPPSIHHATRQPYRWLRAPWEVNPPSMPGWLLRMLAPPPELERRAYRRIDGDTAARRALLRAVDAIRRAPPGSGNMTLNKRAYYVARVVAAGLLSESEAIDALYAAALDRKVPRMEARDTLKSAFRSGWAKPLETIS